MIETRKMLAPGTKVGFFLSMNPKFQHTQLEGKVVNYPRGRYVQTILTMKNGKKHVTFNPVLLVRIKTWRKPLGRTTVTVNARGVLPIV